MGNIVLLLASGSMNGDVGKEVVKRYIPREKDARLHSARNRFLWIH